MLIFKWEVNDPSLLILEKTIYGTGNSSWNYLGMGAFCLLQCVLTLDTFQVNVNLGYFVDAPSLLIVFGGTIASYFYFTYDGGCKRIFGIIGKSWKG